MIRFTVFLFFLFPLFSGFAQAPIRRADTIKVFKNSVQLKNPWVGGHNFVQVSEIDLNQDGIKDLFIFDRTGNKISTYINTGTPNSVSYVHKPEYEKKFPPNLRSWVLLKDYNCDGKDDIFTYSNAGFAVYKNTSSVQNGLQFTLISQLMYSEYSPNNWVNLYVSSVDLPGLYDIDNDGDLDVVTFSLNGTTVEYHKNRSMELYGHCDSLKFRYITGNWGDFSENASNCGININRLENPPTPQHAGSCLLCLDLDNDRAVELLLGDISCCSMAMLFNAGDSSLADFNSFDALYPSNSVSVDLSIFPCGFYLDVDNDGKKDLIVGANAENVSEDNRGIWFYKNTGTAQFPVFTYQMNNFLQVDMIDVGEGAYPVFVDFDADGLKDLLVGNTFTRSNSGNCQTVIATRISAWKNTGTAQNPAFTHVTDNWMNLESQLPGILSMAPTFGDIDGDGDLDMYVGDENGRIHFFPNTAGPGNPIAFGSPVLNVLDANFAVIDVGSNGTPQLFDLNRDGLLDLIIGEKAGNLNYYENTGTAAAPVFTLRSDTLGGIDLSPNNLFQGYSSPFLFSDSGNYELYLGSEKGLIYHYKNIDNNVLGNWTLFDSILWRPNEVNEGIRTNIFGSDLTGDGMLDFVIGNFRGGLGFYIGDLTVGKKDYAFENSFTIYPNPGDGIFNISLLRPLKNPEITVKDISGKIVRTERLSGVTGNRIDLSAFAPGIYFVSLFSEGEVSTRKIVIQR
jgi:hypothetical protein